VTGYVQQCSGFSPRQARSLPALDYILHVLLYASEVSDQNVTQPPTRALQGDKLHCMTGIYGEMCRVQRVVFGVTAST